MEKNKPEDNRKPEAGLFHYAYKIYFARQIVDDHVTATPPPCKKVTEKDVVDTMKYCDALVELLDGKEFFIVSYVKENDKYKGEPILTECHVKLPVAYLTDCKWERIPISNVTKEYVQRYETENGGFTLSLFKERAKPCYKPSNDDVKFDVSINRLHTSVYKTPEGHTMIGQHYDDQFKCKDGYIYISLTVKGETFARLCAVPKVWNSRLKD